MAESLKPIYLLYGDPSLVREFREKLRKEALNPGYESFNYHGYSAAEMDAEEVLQTALTLPVFGGKRVVVVKDCQEMKDRERALFIEYAMAPSVDTCLVLLYGEQRPQAGDKLFSALRDRGYVKELKCPKGRRLEDWIVRYVRKEGKDITPQAVSLLMEMKGDALGELGAELDKLILYKGGDVTIERDDVEESALQTEGAGVFRLIDTIGRKDRAEAMRIFTLLKEEEPLKVLGALAWYVRLLARCRELMDEGLAPEKIASRLRIPGFRVSAYMQAAGRFSQRRLYGLLLLLSEADRLLKGSQQRPVNIIFRLIMELCK